MAFLRNAWYVAGWDGDLAPGAATRIQILNEWIAIYRGDDGTIRAINDVCPHRFASLGEGKVVGNLLECPYHGLRFDEAGRCVHNPHGDGMIPKGAGVKHYPVVAQHSAIWIWMGAADIADPASIPDYSFLTDPGFTACRGYTRIEAHYELVIDNLLDLTHGAYLHPGLIASDSTDRATISVEQDGEKVIYRMWVDNEPVHSTIFGQFWDREEKTGSFRNNLHWMAPSNIIHDVCMIPEGVKSEDAPAAPTAHLITPATDSTAHYFWACSRNRQVEDAGITQKMHEIIDYAFGQEDGPMIEKAFRNMGGREFWALRPVILAGDSAAIRARRILQKLIRAESGSAAMADARTSDLGDRPLVSVGAA